MTTRLSPYVVISLWNNLNTISQRCCMQYFCTSNHSHITLCRNLFISNTKIVSVCEVWVDCVHSCVCMWACGCEDKLRDDKTQHTACVWCVRATIMQPISLPQLLWESTICIWIVGGKSIKLFWFVFERICACVSVFETINWINHLV